jgi:uncharacterized protein YndB with AHSA1/START domain
MAESQLITVETIVNVPVEKAWKCWTTPEDIVQWNHASDEWHCPKAVNDLRVGGMFSYIMAAKDGSFSFDFNGTYTKVVPNEQIDYVIEGGRTVSIIFAEQGDNTRVVETFESETQNPVELQQQGWQSIVDNFKKHAEAQK